MWPWALRWVLVRVAWQAAPSSQSRAAGSDSRCQMMTRLERAAATRALSLPIRLARRRYRSPRKVLVLAAAAAASPRGPLR